MNMNINMMKRDTYNKPYGLFEQDIQSSKGIPYFSSNFQENINMNMNINMKKDTYNKPPASPPGLFEQDSNLRDIQCSYRKGISEHPGRIHRVSTIILETSWGYAVLNWKLAIHNVWS